MPSLSQKQRTSPLTSETEEALAELMALYWDDPFGWVMAAYPWGEPQKHDGSFNPLWNKDGPEQWQADLLIDLGEHIKQNAIRAIMGQDLKVWRSAVASGHGVGKSALVAWIIQFMMATRRDTRGVVTANTANQLETKTWPELSKWHDLLICKHWFRWTATSYQFALYPEEKAKNYMVTAATVSEQNTEAFQGLHNEGKTIFAIFDEASGIFPKLWEVVEGSMTDGEPFFFAFGNPTQPDGAFADCFDKHSHMYWTRHVNSLNVRHTNKEALRDIIRKYGEESDEAKVRVYGQFPSQSFNGFISKEAVEIAIDRDTPYDAGAALIMGIDVARFGPDNSVICYRQGRDARSRPMRVITGRVDTEKLAEIIATEANLHKPDAIVIEGTGVGAGVIDKLRARGFRVIEIHPGAKAHADQHYVNRRSEIWGLMRDWIIDEGVLPDDGTLSKELTAIQYTFDRHEQRIQLESKEDMRERTGLSSPDRADSLALTFAIKIARRDSNLARRNRDDDRTAAITEYDPLTH